MKTFLTGTALVLLAAIPAWAGLTWEHSEIRTEAKPGEKVVTLRYPFRNDGSTPVTIGKVKPSCGCTTVKLEKTVYQPGEAGEIVALFEIGKRTGNQSKRVTVTTSDKAKQTLLFTVRIP